MVIKTVVVGDLDTNCYITGDEKGLIIVDPGSDPQNILKAVVSGQWSAVSEEKKNLQPATSNEQPVTAVILTHAHPDHIGAVGDIVGRFKCPVYMHSLDSDWLKEMLGSKFPGLRSLEDGQAVKAGGVVFTVLHTPGHTEGSVCLYSEKDRVLFSGDTLFADGYGRTDLPGGDEEKMSASLKKLLALPESTNVYPGHGESALIKDIKKTL